MPQVKQQGGGHKKHDAQRSQQGKPGNRFELLHAETRGKSWKP